MNSGRVVLLGATGFIGRSLVESLAGSSAELVVVTRNPQKSRRLFGERVIPAAWDGQSVRGWSEAVDGARAVINLAGESLSTGRWSRKKKAAILDSRRLAGRAVAEAVAAAKIKPGVVIQASAIGLYGNRGDDVLDESSSAGRGFLTEVVEAWERSSEEVERLGVRRVIVRTGVVLGREGGALPIMARPYRFFVGGPLGRGRQWMSWVHIRDEIRAIRFLMENEQSRGIFNLVAPNPVRQRDLARALGRALKRPHGFPVPPVFLRMIFGAKAEETLLVSQRVMPSRLRAAGFSFEFPDVQEALNDLLKRRAP